MDIFINECFICGIDNVPLFQVLKMGKLSVAFILVMISMGITEMVGEKKKTRLQYGYLIDPIEEVVLIRSTSKHIFKAKRLFLHQREVEELMFNITLIEGSLGEVSHSINISVDNCEGRLTHLCKTVKEKFNYITEKIRDVKREVKGLENYATSEDSIQRRASIFSKILGTVEVGGIIGSLAIGVAALQKAVGNKNHLKQLTKKIEILTSIDKAQDKKINEIINRFNIMSDDFDKLLGLVLIGSQLDELASVLEDIHTLTVEFKSQTVEYLYALSLANKNVFTPTLLTPKELEVLINKVQKSFMWSPILDTTRIEFIYGLIRVKLEKDLIVVEIPFQPTKPLTAFRFSPFPTPTHDNSLVIAKDGFVLALNNNNDIVFKLDTQVLEESCQKCHTNKICPINSGRILKGKVKNCTLALLMEPSQAKETLERHHCEINAASYNKGLFQRQLSNGSMVVYTKEEATLQCGKETEKMKNFIIIDPSCDVQTTEETLKGMNTSTSVGKMRWDLIKREGINVNPEPIEKTFISKKIEKLENKYEPPAGKGMRPLAITAIAVASAGFVMLILHLLWKRGRQTILQLCRHRPCLHRRSEASTRPIKMSEIKQEEELDDKDKSIDTVETSMDFETTPRKVLFT